MDEQIKKTILNQITEFTKEAIKQINSSIQPPGDVLIFVDRGISLRGLLPNKFHKLQGEITTKLHQNAGWYKKYSEHFLEELIQDLIINLIEKGDRAGSIIYQDAESQMGGLEHDFNNYSEGQTVYISLAGIQIESGAQKDDELSIGNIVITNLDEAKINKASSDFEPFTSKFKEIITTRRKDKAAFAIYSTPLNEPAEPERALERALGEIRRVFDLFRYAITFLCEEPKKEYKDTRHDLATGLHEGTMVGSPYSISVGLEGEICRDASINLVKSPTQLFMTRGETKRDFVLSAEYIEKMKQIKVFEVSEVLKRTYTYKNDLTGYEDVMLRGIHWIANATNQIERENEILSLFTCLECYFSSTGHSSAGSIADGVTEIIAAQNDRNLLSGGKSKLRSWIKRQYEMRGKITHGRTDVTTKSDLAKLREITKKVTCWIIEHNGQFTTKEELCLWIQCQKLNCEGRRALAQKSEAI